MTPHKSDKNSTVRICDIYSQYIHTDHRDREVYKYKILWIFQCSFWKMLKIQAAINHCLSLIWFPPEMCIRICGRGFAIFVPMMLTDSLLTSFGSQKCIFIVSKFAIKICQIFELAFFPARKCLVFIKILFYRLQFITAVRT